MDEKFIDFMKGFVKNYSLDIFDDKRNCKALLDDCAQGEFNRENRLLMQALELNCHTKIKTSADLNLTGLSMMKQLQDESFITEEAAFEIVKLLMLLIRNHNFISNKQNKASATEVVNTTNEKEYYISPLGEAEIHLIKAMANIGPSITMENLDKILLEAKNPGHFQQKDVYSDIYEFKYSFQRNFNIFDVSFSTSDSFVHAFYLERDLGRGAFVLYVENLKDQGSFYECFLEFQKALECAPADYVKSYIYKCWDILEPKKYHTNDDLDINQGPLINYVNDLAKKGRDKEAFLKITNIANEDKYHLVTPRLREKLESMRKRYLKNFDLVINVPDESNNHRSSPQKNTASTKKAFAEKIHNIAAGMLRQR
jgi:hypothetical protein